MRVEVEVPDGFPIEQLQDITTRLQQSRRVMVVNVPDHWDETKVDQLERAVGHAVKNVELRP